MLHIGSLLEKNDRLLVIEDKLSHRFEAPKKILENQGKKTIVFSTHKHPHKHVANIFDTRKSILDITNSSDDQELYEKLTRPPLTLEKAFVEENFNDFYVETNYTANELGALHFYEKDAGEYITSGVVVVKTENSYNASIHRLLLLDDKRFAARIVPRHLFTVLRKYRSEKKELPITILVGAHPLVVLAASTNPTYGLFELGSLPHFTGEKIKIVKSPLYRNPVPLGTSFVVEARITLEDTDEGPFIDALMTYDKVRKQPVIEIDGVWKISVTEPYYYSLLPGGYEHAFLMGLPREARIYHTVQQVVPYVKKVRLTMASGGWLHCIISIRKTHDGDGKNAIMAAFTGHPSLKHVVVVDDDIDPDNHEEVEWAIATRFQADKDLILIREARGSTLDPSSRDGITAKMGIDATVPVNEREKYERGRIPG